MTSRSFVLCSIVLVLSSPACDPSDEDTDAGAQGSEDGGSQPPAGAGSGGGSESDGGSVVGRSDAGGGTGGGPAVVDAGPPPEPCPEPEGEGTTHEGVIDADETWTLEDSPHVVTFDLSIQSATLTIEECAVVRVREGYQVTIGGTGDEPDSALVAHGAPRRPVVFQPDEEGTYWGSLRALPTGRIDLEHVWLRGGGAHATAQSGGGTLVAVGAGGPALSRMLHTVDVQINASEGLGVNLQSYAAFSEGSRDLMISDAGQTPSPNNVVTDYPMRIAPPALQTIPTGSYGGNAIDAIEVFNQSQVDLDETFRARGVPYLLSNGFAMGPEGSGQITLTLEAGITLLFPRDESDPKTVSLGLGSPVRVVAEGTEEDPIVLTSAEETPMAGDWVGIEWAGGPEAGNLMSFVRLEYAGADSGVGSFGCGPDANDAALIITGWRPSDDFIDELTVSDSAGGGIVCGWTSDEEGPDLAEGNTFTDIANGCNVARWKRESSPACESAPDCL